MKSRGLTIDDADRAERYVRHIGYYRLSPYAIPLQIPGPTRTFRPEAEFDHIVDLYVFDRALRLLVMDAIERVEVALRSALTDHMSTKHGNPHWYLDPAHFGSARSHAWLLDRITESCDKQLEGGPEPEGDGIVHHRSALEHYLTTYGNPELPPSWLMVEGLTIGQLDGLIRNLKLRADRTAIAEPLGITEPLLTSWLRSYVRVRNICAHHGRLWNAGLGVYPAIPKPKSETVPWLADREVMEVRRRRLYPVLVSLQSLLTTVSPRSSWAVRLSDLLREDLEVPLAGMGVPVDWREDAFWTDAMSRAD